MNIAIILSGGVGTRMGTDIPKQYIMVGGKPIIIYCIKQFMDSGFIDAFIISLDPQWKSLVETSLIQLGVNCPVFYSLPGETRQHTIYQSLKCAVANGFKDDDIVIIHDAVRPLVDKDIIEDCLKGCMDNDAAIATVDVKDTIYVSMESGCITGVPQRSTLHAGQTPEAFKLGKYLSIHNCRSYEEISVVTGGAEFAFRCGMKVFLSKGKEINFKLTTPEDLHRFEQIINQDNE
ncbi:IspD/TarI family cytidylyltransferase [Phocaeicola sartorii]|uniref:2-C-methyl-D-erythritol 4-phosphate cytidylyltransferase n=1 Tax=Phocaeicola sartorii TaxID=671267 RepID=A0A4S2FPQ5_9BACT|nr:IspD/TarI family cytidylyltransferase [Phocaeicola sartorii]TGY71032.1 2-C-methyl-D-erythritol 4-phosphate cytidylyltransferase [Phocaeicola sartorii]GFH97773.1 ribitol-5-phosphate cytidylyltransferase [Bacteroidaceae bacterium]